MMRVSRRFTAESFILILSLLILLLVGCGPAVTTAAQSEPTSLPSPTAAAATERPAIVTEGAVAALEGTLSQIYEQVSPSVVHIQVVREAPAAFMPAPLVPGMPGLDEAPEGQQRGEGSGFAWDGDGHIVTNNHVVAGATDIDVIFVDGTILSATLVGSDPDSDLAVLKVDEVPEGLLRPVRLADSTTVKVGDLVIAIGNPFGQNGTMTVGFVSALGRLLPVANGSVLAPRYNIPDVIQTDAAINPGNSGGVLVNDQGEVIGVTSAIISPVRASSGIGFAIPSAIVEKVVPALIETGHYEHPYLGIAVRSLTPELTAAMNLPVGQRGALIADVVPDSPADKAGLWGSDRATEIDGRPERIGGDVIVAIEGQPVRSSDDLITYLARHTGVGQTVELTVLRAGAERSIEVVLAARPRGDQQAQQQATAGQGGWLGILGADLTPETAAAMDLPATQSGVLIIQVQHGSPADEAGLQGSFKPVIVDGNQFLVGGDVIVAADGQPVDDLASLQAILTDAAPGAEMTLTVLRNGSEQLVTVTLGERP